MLDWMSKVIESGGYFGVLLLMFLENVFPPLPSELIMPLAGFAAERGELSMVGVIIAGTVGSMIGQLPLYYIGHLLGQDRLRRLAGRHGRWLAVEPRDIDSAADWFARHGAITVLVCRVIPGVRSLISIPAGIHGMPLPRFLLLSTVGTVVWVALLAWLGSLLGENYHRVERYVSPIAIGVLAALVLAYIIRVVCTRCRRRPAGVRASPAHADGD